MFHRTCLSASLLAGAALAVSGCTTSNTSVASITVSPASQSVAVGQTAQLAATGTIYHGSHPATSENVTSTAAWTSSNSSVAIVGPCTSGTNGCPTGGLAAGEVLGEGNGSATITATLQGNTSAVPGSASIGVTGGTGTGPVSSTSLISLTIIPSSISVGAFEETGNFLAIGTYSVAPQVRDVTNSVVWTSSFPNVFPVDSNTGGNVGATAGIVTAYGSGTDATIMAEVTDPVTKSIQYATATFSCTYVAPCPCSVEQGCSTAITVCPNGPVAGACYPGSQGSALLSTVTVYNEGLNDTNWYVTAPSATGTPDVIHCGPGWTGTGGSVCVATYPIGTPFVLTAPAGAGAFGGWSLNCTPVVSPTNLTPTNISANGPNYCELNPTTSSETVGAIFN
jgi:hypothetical protein